MFTVTSYNGMNKVARPTFTQAANAADRFARVGDLPSTITDHHGCRWVVWAGATPALKSCPAVGRCECAEVYA